MVVACVFMRAFVDLQEMRGLRSEIIYLCKYRMANAGGGGDDALVVLLHKLLGKVVLRKLPSAKRTDGRLLRSALKVILETVRLMKGGEGAARVIYMSFTGLSGSALVHNLTKQFDDAALSRGKEARGGAGAQGRDDPNCFSGGGSRAFKRRYRPAKPFDRKSDACYKCGEVGECVSKK